MQNDLSATLSTHNDQTLFQPIYCLEGNCIDRANTTKQNGAGWKEGISYTLNTIDRPAVCYSIDRAAFNQGENAQYDFEISDKDTAPTLVAKGPSAVCYPKESTEPRFAAAFKSNMSAKTYGIGYEEDIAPTISAEQHDASVVYAIENGRVQCYDARGNGDGNIAPTLTGSHESSISDYTAIVAAPRYLNSSGEETAGTLDASYYKGVGERNGIEREFVLDLVCWIIRRLTPLECERLQGFPDGWTDIGDYIDGKGKRKKTTDSARYKALGNSIAIPPWTWVLRRVALACGADRTMASLFDGIGGFPLIWERINGKGFCLWTSEIEEFCIAVTEKRFKEE